MNIQLLNQSPHFQEFMDRVRELHQEAHDILKTETDLIKIGRAQGRLLAIDDILGLPDQIEAEDTMEDE